MASNIDPRISKARKILQNPYAFLDGDDEFSADYVHATDSSDTRKADQRITDSRRLLQNQYAHLDGDGFFSAEISTNDALPDQPAVSTSAIDLFQFNSPENRHAPYSDDQIEDMARRLQRALWTSAVTSNDGTLKDPFDLLNPALAFQKLGFTFEATSAIGHTREASTHDIAGCIDIDERYAAVSTAYPRANQRFTGAHELGHALLHPPMQMHRERSLDGSQPRASRPRKEIEADKFASNFLMPAKLLRQEFFLRFQADQFVLSDDTAFMLTGTNQEETKKQFRSRRLLARRLASCTRFSSSRFTSLADRFGVSVEAIAIRIEELDLL